MAGQPRTGVLIGIGSAIVGFVVVGLVAGLFLDRLAHSTPLFTLVGLAVGVTGTIWYSYRQLRPFLEDPITPKDRQ